MNANESSNGQSSRPSPMHIHNYSGCAIQSLILEIKKYPIIFNGNAKPDSDVSKQLINLAWSRIVLSLLPNSNLAQIKYWDRSFREAWKWMQSVLVKDMSERSHDRDHIRNPRNAWLTQLRFLEPFIDLNDISSHGFDCASFEPEIFADFNATDNVVISVKDSMESPRADNTHISICFRVKESSSLSSNGKPFAIELGSQQSSVVVAEHRANSILNFTQSEASIGYLQVEGATPMVSDENPSAIEFCAQPSAKVNKSVLVEYHIDLECSAEDLPTNTSPLQRQAIEENFEKPSSSVAEYDEDYCYIMSLLPKLKNLEPKRNTEVKKLMLQAALSLLNEEYK